MNQRPSRSVATADSQRQGLVANRNSPTVVPIENVLAVGRARRSVDPTQQAPQRPTSGLIEPSSDTSASQRPGRWNEGEIVSLKRLISRFSTDNRVDWVALLHEWQSLGLLSRSKAGLAAKWREVQRKESSEVSTLVIGAAPSMSVTGASPTTTVYDATPLTTEAVSSASNALGNLQSSQLPEEPSEANSSTRIELGSELANLRTEGSSTELVNTVDGDLGQAQDQIQTPVGSFENTVRLLFKKTLTGTMSGRKSKLVPKSQRSLGT